MVDFKKLREDRKNKTPDEVDAERHRVYQEISIKIRAQEDARNRHIFRMVDDPRLNHWEREFIAKMATIALRDIRNRGVERDSAQSTFTDRMNSKIQEMVARYAEINDHDQSGNSSQPSFDSSMQQ